MRSASHRLNTTLITLAIGLTIPTLALAKSPADPTTDQAPLTKLRFDLAYDKELPEIKEAQKFGLNAHIISLIDDPQTPYGQRAALIQAAVMSKKTPNPSARYIRYLKQTYGAKHLELGKLATHEAFNLGWMRALESPDTAASLSPIGGDSEAERAEPLTLLTAASNRLRGDMTIQLTHALLKAQLAHLAPERALCSPARCVDAVVENYPTHWSMAPEAVCQSVAAVSSAKAKPKTGTKLCERIKQKHPDAPIYKPTPDSPDPLSASNQSRFTQSIPQSGTPQITMHMLQGMGLPPGFLPPNLPMHDPVAMQRFMQQHIQQQMQAIQQGVAMPPSYPHAHPNGAQVIDLTPPPQGSQLQTDPSTSQHKIHIEAGHGSSQSSTSNEEINLDAEDDESTLDSP